MPRLVPRRSSSQDTYEAIGSGLSGLVDGLRAGRADRRADEALAGRNQALQAQSDIRAQQFEAQVAQAEAQAMKQQRFRDALSAAAGRVVQSREAQWGAATFQSAAERQSANERLSSLRARQAAFQELLPNLDPAQADDARLAYQQLAQLEATEVIARDFAGADMDVRSAMQNGYLPEEVGQDLLERMQDPSAPIGPQDAREIVQKHARMFASSQAAARDRDETMQMAEAVRNGSVSYMSEDQRQVFDELVQLYQIDLFRKLDRQSFLDTLRAVSVLDPAMSREKIQGLTGINMGVEAQLPQQPVMGGDPGAPPSQPAPQADNGASMLEKLREIKARREAGSGADAEPE